MDIPVAPPEAYENYFVQELAPIGGSLVGSFFVGVIPLILLLLLLGAFRMPAHFAAISGLIVCIFIAIFAWHMPAKQAFLAIANGLVFANWPIMWIVFNAMNVYNTAVHSGIFDIFRRWMLTNAPPDRRVFLVLIAFSFCAILEGVAGFGTPGAICSALLVSLGFKPLDALTFVLLFDTTPVAFGALGIPVTTLARLTNIEASAISAMLGRQLPLFSLFLPLYALFFYCGFRAGVIECWPLALVAGVSFAVVQGIFANFVGPELPDLLSGLVSLFAIVIFVQFWKPPYREEFRAFLVANPATGGSAQQQDNKSSVIVNSAGNNSVRSSISDNGSRQQQENGESQPKTQTAFVENVAEPHRDPNVDPDEETGELSKPPTTAELVKPTLYETIIAWSPWIIIVVLVVIWTFAGVSKYGEQMVQIPNLHGRVWLTLYDKPYDAIWDFQPLATGTCILVSAILFDIIVLLYGGKPIIFWYAFRDTCKQLVYADITVSAIMAFAYLYNYSGIVYTVGLTLAQVGRAFPFLSAWIGWVGCFLTGSDTSANSLFGNLQVVAARQIGLSTVLMAATNTSGAVTSKMISPQTLTTGVSTIGMRGKEGHVLRRTILHSIFFACLIGAMACIQQYLIPGIIPPWGDNEAAA
ncbi:lactate permease [Zychaea mexicana]|uniref:lactate permease n=1 Tax=Zychaea mexicana TaxID=64656 RepID=UPI0022FF13A1|nr:lactate permease [Zychaea mexicana]KAI9498349.1 lactate permease [Zychaea mexicana]